MEQVIIKLELSVDEVNAIVGTLGELPTKSNTWPLVQKIITQAQPQVPVPLENNT